MPNKYIYFYFILIIFFCDIHLGFRWIMMSTIASYYILFITFLSSKKVKLKRISSIFVPFMLFLIYIFIINIYQNTFAEALSYLIPFIPLPFILYALNNKPNNDELIYTYVKLWLIINCFFCFLQFFGIHIILSDITSLIPFFEKVYSFDSNIDFQGLRISGATYSIIGFASQLGMMWFYFYYNKTHLYSKRTRFYFLTLIILLILFTQTRSLIFLLVPIIIITNALVNNKFLALIRTASFLSLILFILLFFKDTLLDAFPRLFLNFEDDGSIVHRIQANVYSSIGTFYTSPFIGVSFDDALKVMQLGYSKIKLFYGSFFIEEVTHHNQPLYYFRYYGFIGLFFLLFIYYRFLQFSKSKHKTVEDKRVIYSIIIFHFLYTLSHNNTIFTDQFLWIFLSLHSYNYINKSYLR